ncbi:hypothetical protein Sjap_010023 [Stephania japonica]|uniref:Pleckstrin-like plant domain-containing protein n=1 Tax=Stephania japonica TaxID=461633 RepID=A0AAP0P6R6_9MAGN
MPYEPYRKRKMMDGADTDPADISENNFINHLQSVANLVIYMLYSKKSRTILNESTDRFQEQLTKGDELLKRTHKGNLHLKIVSVYINRLDQVTLKMKSRHVAETITKKKKNIVLEICKDMSAWPGQADTYSKAESIDDTLV